MNDKRVNGLAADALDDYLNVLLCSDEPLACEQTTNSPKRLSESKLYHLNTQPKRQSRNLISSLSDSQGKSQSKAQSLQPDTEKRHQFERVERLLDDFNRRHKTENNKELSTELQLKDEQKVVLQPSLLSLAEKEQTATESAIEEVQQKVFTPKQTELVREEWSNAPFQTLLFDVSGIRLALPLIKLGGIHRLTEEIKPLFGKPKCFMGILPGLEGNINVIDTAKWIMPEKYDRLNGDDLDYKFIILLGDTNWGLACNEVQNAIKLAPDNVRWRASLGKRPWLAGMLIEELCALLDVDTLVSLLNESYYE